MSPLSKRHAAERRVKHVILISIDTLRADALSCYSAEGAPTPNIDRLATQSIVFRNARAASPWTLATMASILTGFPVDVHQAFHRDSKLPQFLPTLAGRLKEAGYVTAAAGVNGYLKPKAGLARGFDEYHFDVQEWFEKTDRPIPDLPWLEPGRRKEPMYTGTPCLTEFASEWFEANQDRHFFLWLHFLDPHGPYWPPPEFRPDGVVPEAVKGALHSRKATYSIKTPEEKRMHTAFYKGEVRWVDEAIGKLVGRLKALGMYDEALIVLTSDHGEEFWEHGSFDHGHTLYDELIHVPLIVKLPLSLGEDEAGTWDRMWGDEQMSFLHGERLEVVSNQGIAPMILDACGVTDEDSALMTGSLSPFVGLDVGKVPARAGTFSSGLLYGKNRECVLFDGLKYIVCPELGKAELFDLRADPSEKKSLLDVRPEEVERAESLLGTHRKAAEAIKSHYRITNGERIELDEETVEELRALGYVL